MDRCDELVWSIENSNRIPLTEHYEHNENINGHDAAEDQIMDENIVRREWRLVFHSTRRGIEVHDRLLLLEFYIA